MTYQLLSVAHDAKTIKGQKLGYLTGILYLAPANIAGARSVCPHSTKGCRRVCLYTAGRGGFNSVQQARIRKTQAFWANPSGFIERLAEDCKKLIAAAKAKGMIPAVRLNGTSDIQWEKYGIMERFPDLQFYDYTKFPANKRWDLPKNYHLTYSISEKDSSAQVQAFAWKMRGVNSTMVFSGMLPPEWSLVPGTVPWPVIDGDLSDLRFLDPKGVIVGLKTKGKARKDDGDGFVRNGFEWTANSMNRMP